MALLLLDVEVALAIKDDLADDAVVVMVIPELIALGIDIAGSMEVDDIDIPGIDIAVSIEVDMPGMDICARLLLANRRAGVMIVANNMVDDCVGLCCRLLTGGLARCKCWATM